MKTVLYVVAGYLAVIGVSEFIANSSTNSPTFDSIASFPSVGSFVAKSSGQSTEAIIDLVSAAAIFAYAKYRG